MADVVARLSEEDAEHLRQVLAGDFPMPEPQCPRCKRIRAALDSPPVEDWEFRVVSEFTPGADLHLGGAEAVHANLITARRRCAEYARGGVHKNVRMQSRTITTFSDGSSLTSPWTDLPSGEGERDGE